MYTYLLIFSCRFILYSSSISPPIIIIPIINPTHALEPTMIATFSDLEPLPPDSTIQNHQFGKLLYRVSPEQYARPREITEIRDGNERSNSQHNPTKGSAEVNR